jgi:hypothetical protein
MTGCCYPRVRSSPEGGGDSDFVIARQDKRNTHVIRGNERSTLLLLEFTLAKKAAGADC